MSNFGVTYLLKINKGNKRLSIEDNIGEELHIHFGEMRLMLNNKEFKDFAYQALDYISDVTDIPMETIEKLDSIFLFDLCRKGELPSLKLHQIEYVPVGKLLCPVKNAFGVWKYKPIGKSHFIKVMKNKAYTTPFDRDQINYYGKTNSLRCEEVLKLCNDNKDICEISPLYVTQNNEIRDGQHRAAALFLLYGAEFKVRVQRMETDRDSSSLKNRFKENVKVILYKIISVARVIETKKLSRKKDAYKYQKIIASKINKEAFDLLRNDNEFRSLLFCVEPDIALSRFPVFIRRKGTTYESIEELFKKKNYRMISGHKNAGITFIYGLGEDYLVIDKNNRPVAFLQDKISSYAMQVKSFMPYAPEIQKYLEEFDELPVCITYVLRLLKCMFDKDQQGFFEKDISFFEQKRDVLDTSFFEKNGLVEKVFFYYSDRLVELLRKGLYDKIIDDYRKFEY